MSTVIFYYDDFCEFEVVLCASHFKNTNFYTVALENRIYVSSEKQKFIPDKTIKDINPDEVDLFIIPGGDPSNLYQNQELKSFIDELYKNKKYIAGICGGTFLMAAYGYLDNKKCTGDSSGIDIKEDYSKLFKNAIITNEDVVVDENIITSTGQAFIEFSFVLSKLMKLNKDETHYKWFKNIKE